MAGEVAGEVPSFPAWRQPSVSQVKIAALGQIHGIKCYFIIHQSLDETVSSICGTRSVSKQALPGHLSTTWDIKQNRK